MCTRSLHYRYAYSLPSNALMATLWATTCTLTCTIGSYRQSWRVCLVWPCLLTPAFHDHLQDYLVMAVYLPSGSPTLQICLALTPSVYLQLTIQLMGGNSLGYLYPQQHYRQVGNHTEACVSGSALPPRPCPPRPRARLSTNGY